MRKINNRQMLLIEDDDNEDSSIELRVLSCLNWWRCCDDETQTCWQRCRQNGRSLSNRFNQGSGQIWLDNVVCTGTESSIVNCQHNDWGDHNCEHSQDVSISCAEIRPTLPSPSLNNSRTILHRLFWNLWVASVDSKHPETDTTRCLLVFTDNHHIVTKMVKTYQFTTSCKVIALKQQTLLW